MVLAFFQRTSIFSILLIIGLVFQINAGGGGPAPAKARELAIELGAPFCDNAIFQRGMQFPVWGWSKSGTEVTVSFAGQTKTATAGNDGKWMLQLNPLKASFTPAEMTVSEKGGKKETIKNILVGEVWMASGQSNMQWKVGKSACIKLLDEITKLQENGGKAPEIREFEVRSVTTALHPVERATGSWNNKNYTNYSAIAFAFAYKLYNELEVPIGILNCSWSQTAIQAWVPREGYATATDDYSKAIYKKVLETDPSTPEHHLAWSNYYDNIENKIKENTDNLKKGLKAKTIDIKTPGNLKVNRDSCWLFNGRLNPVIPFAIQGCIWNQGYANSNEGLPYYNNLHSLIRGWRIKWNKPNLPVYFHQFYSAGLKKGTESLHPSIGSTSEMRLGTWLARDIPNTGMASQIDITGAIHYSNKAVPGYRLARHALKNQYGQQDLVADGPMYKSYKAKGNQIIVEFNHAEGGLIVGQTTMGRELAHPKEIKNGEAQVNLFYIADENRVWYPATVKIDGNKIIVSSPKVNDPRGISYATSGVGGFPNIYNKAKLPMTPFIYYDNKLVTSKTWPDEKLKIDGVVINPASVGIVYQYRKMPLLSTQFRDNAVLQAGKPLIIWGSAVHDWGFEAEGKAVIKFEFAGHKKTIPVVSGMKEWSVTLPAMKASAKPNTLKVSYEIDGKLVHERISENIVLGDVWYVASYPQKLNLPKVKSTSIVRVMKRKSKRSTSTRLSRFSVCVSTTPKNRFACTWKETGNDLAGYIGHTIGSKTGNPVGIIFMENAGGKGATNPDIKSWMPPEYLKNAPSMMEDYKTVGSQYPDNPYYAKSLREFITTWKKYWAVEIPNLIKTKKNKEGANWGSYPTAGKTAAASTASRTYNSMVHSFTPATLKGIIFFTNENMSKSNDGKDLASEISALANSYQEKFANSDSSFFYTVPSSKLVSGATKPKGIKSNSTGVELNSWKDSEAIVKLIKAAAEL